MGFAISVQAVGSHLQYGRLEVPTPKSPNKIVGTIGLGNMLIRRSERPPYKRWVEGLELLLQLRSKRLARILQYGRLEVLQVPSPKKSK